MANVRWLAGYRYLRCLRPAVAAAAPAVFAEPTPLMDGATRLGDPLASLPTVFHLLWCGRAAVASCHVPAAADAGSTRLSSVQPAQPRSLSNSISRRAGGAVSNASVSISLTSGGSMSVSST